MKSTHCPRDSYPLQAVPSRRFLPKLDRGKAEKQHLSMSSFQVQIYFISEKQHLSMSSFQVQIYFKFKYMSNTVDRENWVSSH